jgi:hypothetical protein
MFLRIGKPLGVRGGTNRGSRANPSQKTKSAEYAARNSLKDLAGPTRLELATSCVTGRRSNRLNYGPAFGEL